MKMIEKEKERIKERRSVQERATHTPASQQEELIYLEEERLGTNNVAHNTVKLDLTERIPVKGKWDRGTGRGCVGTEKDRKENRELKGKSQEEGGMKVTEEGGIEWE